jgi:hypothetical protein
MRENRKFLLLWLALVAVFVLSHFRFYFLEAGSEFGDFAINALEIRKAKFFCALYGNPSRWGFRHPGPVFLYIYAAGEFLLHDLLHAVRSPYSAHIIAGIITQTGFFVWSLSILRHHVRHSLVIPLVLVAGALHFSAVNYNLPASSFQSVWLPHVLLFPFLCFLVACAAMASGSLTEILPAIVCGGMLVHGHVAQPLFVVPFFILACVAFATGSLMRRQSAATELRKHRNRLIVSGMLLMVFLLPIFLDWLKAEKSNLHLFQLHLAQHSGDHKTVSQSLAYLCTFLCYLAEPEKIFDAAGKPDMEFLWERWPFTAVWILIAVALLAFAPIASRRSNRFVRWLYIYFGIGIALTICWGVLQSGLMFNFNSYFNFGLLFVAVILVIIALCAYVPVPANPRSAIVFSLAAIPLYLATVYPWRFDIVFRDQQQAIQLSGLKNFAENDGGAVKYLKFNHPDWPWAAGVAVALQRLGFQFAVPPQWEFMFGREHRLNRVTPFQKRRVSVWNFGPRQGNTAGVQLTNDLFVRRSAPSINPDGSEITFAGSNINAPEYILEGWDFSDRSFSWSTSRTGLIYFHPQPASADVNISIEVFPATFSRAKSQRMTVWFNDSIRRDYDLTAPETVNMQIPATIWNQESDDYLVFEFPDAISPLAAGVSQDSRQISCGFTRIRFEESNVAPSD